MKGFRFELDRENPHERKWSIAEAADGSLIVTAFAADEEQSDQIIIERFNHFLNVRPPEPGVLNLPVTVVAECMLIKTALVRVGADPNRVPPVLVPRMMVVELYEVLKIPETVAKYGTAEIMGVAVAWHEALDIAAARRIRG